MSPRARIASISVASVAAVGLCVAIGVATPASAEPCIGPAAAAQPQVGPAMPSAGGMPIGHRPPHANAFAPLPKLGMLSTEIIKAFVPQSGTVQQQAAVAPAPTPPGKANQLPPTAAQPVPEAAP